MSVVTVTEAKRYLRVFHTSDDALIQDLIDDAEDECREYLDRDVLPRIDAECPDDCDTSAPAPDPVSDGSDLPRSIRRGILLIVQGAYEGKDADEMIKLRAAAIQVWHPARCRFGV